MKIIATIIFAITIPAIAQWELVIDAPTALTNNLPADVSVTSLMGTPMRTASGGTIYVLGKESPARDHYNRLTAAGVTPYPCPRLVDVATGYSVGATSSNIANRAALLAAWQSDQPPEVRLRSLQFTGPARVEVDADDGHVYGLEIDPEDGTVFVVQRQSTRKTWAEYAVARAAEKAARAAARAAAKAELDGLKAKLATAEAEIEKLKKK